MIRLKPDGTHEVVGVENRVLASLDADDERLQALCEAVAGTAEAERVAVLAEIQRVIDWWGPRHTTVSTRVCAVLRELQSTIRFGRHLP